MRVAVTGFGSVWRHRLGKFDAHGPITRAVYYNTTGVPVHDRVRQRPQICGYARFDTIGGFDPHHSSKMIGRVFECAEPSAWMGYNKLLFRRLLSTGEHPDYFLVIAKSEFVGALPLGNEDWRCPDTWLLSLSECLGQQETMLLMSIGDWFRTGIGKFVLESSATGCALARLALQVGE